MSKGYLRFLRDLRRHAVATLFLASFFLVLEEYLHVLGWLDSVMLRLAYTLHLELAGSSAGSPGSASMRDKSYPVVITFGDEVYERHFRERSPLDRAQLRAILAQIVIRGPKMVVIDLDLSSGLAGSDSAQAKLDDFLKQHASRIVSITPFPPATPELRQIKYKWMRDMCGAGVRFGLPEIIQSHGVVLRHSVSPQALANVAVDALEKDKTEDGCEVAQRGKAGSCSRKGALLTPCQQVCNCEPNAVPFLSPFGERDGGEPTPINYRYFEDFPLAVITLDSYPNPNHLSDLPDLKDRVVFFGGTYGPFDKYLAPIGELDGVMLHAAAFFTSRNPVGSVNRIIAYLGDLVLGVALGFLFHAVWAKYHRWRTDSRSGEGSAYRELSSVLFVVNLAILALLTVFVMVAGAYLLRIGYWLNPGPMMIGMFLDTFGASKPQTDDHHTDIARGGRGPRSFLSAAATTVRWLKYGCAWALVGFSWLLLAREFVHWTDL